MSDLPTAQTLLRAGEWRDAAAIVELDYAGRFLRRKRLETSTGERFVVDLAQTTSLNHGDALALGDGRCIEIRAAPEAVLIVKGPNLAQLAWHIGNRHTPCQIGTDHVVIQNDPVIRHMLAHLGADMTEAQLPFTPEGGAYGHGRTHAHEHGATAHSHAHSHAH